MRIAPVAVTPGGKVLFRWSWSMDPTGAHRPMRQEYGWLVVDARGVWEEVTDVVLEEPNDASKDAVAGYDAASKQAEQGFTAAFAWSAPPKAVVPLLAKHGFKAAHAVRPDLGAGTVTWHPDRLCRGKRCVPACVQRSLKGLVSERDAADRPVPARFYASGVALFENVWGSDSEAGLERDRGPRFADPRGATGETGEPMWQTFAGLCFVPSWR